MHRVFWAGIIACTLIGFTPASSNASGLEGLVPALDSALIDGPDLGGNVVLVDFWASWCVPCRNSFPWLSRLQSKYRDRGLRVVAINLDKKRQAAESFVSQNDSSLAIVYDPEGLFARRVELEVMPTSFLYDRTGQLQETHLGFSVEDTLATEHLIESLLKSTEAP